MDEFKIVISIVAGIFLFLAGLILPIVYVEHRREMALLEKGYIKTDWIKPGLCYERE